MKRYDLSMSCSEHIGAFMEECNVGDYVEYKEANKQIKELEAKNKELEKAIEILTCGCDAGRECGPKCPMSKESTGLECNDLMEANGQILEWIKLEAKETSQ